MKKIYYLFVIFFLFQHETLNAKIHIQINEGIDNARPIVIVPFMLNQNIDIQAENISNIIRFDLNNTGKFNSLDFKILPQYPKNITEINSDLWKEKNVNIIVIGKMTLNSDLSYNISYQLINIVNKSKLILLENKYKVSKKSLRYVAHIISNEIFEKLTNIKGVFCTRIAYVTKNINNIFPYELQVSDYDGYNNFIAYRSINPIMSPTWAPDGKKIAYVIFENNHSSIVIQTLKTGIIRKIVSYNNHNGAPSFSFDGNKLAFASSKTGNLNIYVMDLSKNIIHQITNNNFINTEPTWFPDNQMLAFTSDKEGLPQIYQVNINNKITQRITWKGKNQNSNIDKDGKFIFMIHTHDGKQHLIKQDLKTGNIYALTDTFLDETPSVSPNGVMVIYSYSQDNCSVLELISTNGLHKRTLLINSTNVKFPTWSPFLG